MSRAAVIIIFFSFIYSISKGDSVSDSLNLVIAKETNDSTKVVTMLALSKYYLGTDPIVAARVAGQAKELAQKVNFQKGVALALKNIGIARYNQNKFIEALQNWQQALVVFEKIGDKVGVSNMYSNIGAIYQIKGDDAKSLESHLNSLKVAESINDTLRILTAYINMGAVYYNKPQNYGKALENYMKALPLSEEIGDSDAIGVVTVNIGEIYFKRGDDSTALVYFERSYKAYGENSENTPYSLNDIGMVYQKRGDYSKAISYHLLAYEKAKKLDAKMDMAIS